MEYGIAASRMFSDFVNRDDHCSVQLLAPYKLIGNAVFNFSASER